jgi:hypothetical protein
MPELLSFRLNCWLNRLLTAPSMPHDDASESPFSPAAVKFRTLLWCQFSSAAEIGPSGL